MKKITFIVAIVIIALQIFAVNETKADDPLCDINSQCTAPWQYSGLTKNSDICPGCSWTIDYMYRLCFTPPNKWKVEFQWLSGTFNTLACGNCDYAALCHEGVRNLVRVLAERYPQATQMIFYEMACWKFVPIGPAGIDGMAVSPCYSECCGYEYKNETINGHQVITLVSSYVPPDDCGEYEEGCVPICDPWQEVPTNKRGINSDVIGNDIYPNPATNEVHCKFSVTEPSDMTVYVYNEAGQMVQMQSLKAGSKEIEITISVNEFAKGYYSFFIESNGINIKAGKFIVE